MQRRRIYFMIGLGLAWLALVALAWRPWSAQAAYPTAGSNAASNAGAYESLNGVPLRGEWWNTPYIAFDAETRISTKLKPQLDNADAAGRTVGFMVYLKAQANTANNESDWHGKGEYVLDVLERVKAATQPRVMQEVARQQALGNITGKVSQFTIINAIFVHGNTEAARALGRLHDVAYVEADHRYTLQDNRAGQMMGVAGSTVATQDSPEAVELGVSTVNAPQAWANGYLGDGVVVGSIDTGVEYTHPALNRQYRGNLGGGNYDHNYNWWDTREDAPRQFVPYDDDGHGTHTTGTVLGEDASQTNQIGVAPHAKWIATKVFPGGGSSGNEEITPAQDFMLAPWDLNQQNRRPDLRPHVINNSWGDGECWNTDSWLITQAWIDAGIMPAFSNGNSGPAAGSVGSPGAYPFLIGVGAINAGTANLTIAGFSSRGPSCYGGVLKPDVVAPGVNVRSSIPGGLYGPNQGTSMAAPHVSGVMALILSANPSLTYSDVTGILTRTTFFHATWGSRPNNNYGWGLVKADAATNMAVHGPHVSGVVSGPSHGARVTARRTSDNDTYTRITRAGGAYSMTVLAGTYDVEVSAFGYQTATISGQNWLSDTSPVLNVNLTPLATFTLSGYLFQNGSCAPLSGTVTISPPGTLVVPNNPVTGAYSVSLPAGTYTVTADAGAGYKPIVDVVTVGGNMTHNFTFGPAYDSTYVVDMPAPNFIAGSTLLTFDNGEDGYSAVTLPFAFSFYTGTYTTMNVSTNGYITFKDLNYARMWANMGIPNPGPAADSVNYRYPNNGIYPYWDDMSVEPRTYGDVYTGVSGSAPNRIFVVEWRGVGGADDPVTFEVQMEETTNRITFVYQDLAAPFGFGYSSTAGIEDDNGTSAIQLSFNQPGRLGSNTAFRFTMGTPPAITPCTGPTATPTAPGATATATSQVSVTPTACTLMFTDVPSGHTFYENIRCLACRGIINGYSTGCETGNPCFRPGNLVTRGQLAKIVSNSAGFSEPVGAQMFEDVPPGHTFYDFIWRLADRGIINGYPCGGPGEPCVLPDNLPYFRPNANITRGQISKIVAEAAGLTQPPGAQQFEDVAPGHTFYDYIWRLTSLGIMNGYPCGGLGEPCMPPDNLPYFRPGANATRGQASKIVANTFFPECVTPSR
jgi:subtilisin family serine protease